MAENGKKAELLRSTLGKFQFSFYAHYCSTSEEEVGCGKQKLTEYFGESRVLDCLNRMAECGERHRLPHKSNRSVNSKISKRSFKFLINDIFLYFVKRQAI